MGPHKEEAMREHMAGILFGMPRRTCGECHEDPAGVAIVRQTSAGTKFVTLGQLTGDPLYNAGVSYDLRREFPYNR